MKNMVYIQSGGPTSVINTSLYGAIKEARLHKDEIDNIYGSLHGIEGLIDDDLIDINKEDEKQIELLLQTPGAILGTTRRKLPKDVHDPIYLKIVENLNKHQIKYVFINGGNDSMDTCDKLAYLVKELKLDITVIGVPKTIDNDLACTDHSLGFPSAAKFVVNAVNFLSKDCQCFKKGKVTIVEIMGRHVGWLSASVDLLPEDTRPHLIYVPEHEFDLDKFLNDVHEVYEKHQCALVALSEGIVFPRDEVNAKLDAFGHVQLGGAAHDLCEIIEKKFGYGTRAIELSLTQRAFSPLISKVDQDEAIQTGREAVKAALAKQNGKMVVFKRVSNHPYKINYELADVSLVANAESRITKEMICDNTRMSEVYREYLRPLIEGEVNVEYSHGIALESCFKYVKVK